MRIALIIKDLSHGGAERVVSRLSIILRDAGHDVFIVLFSDDKIDYDHAGKIITLNSAIRKTIFGKAATNIQRIKNLRKIKKEYKFDSAISFLDTPNIANILTKDGEIVVVSVRNYKSLEDAGLYRFINKVMIKALYPKSDKVVVVSRALLNDMLNNYGIPMDKLKAIYNPYDIDQISDMSLEELPAEYQDFYDDHRVIAAMGRLTKQKGYWNLIKAFASLKKVYQDAGLVIIGDGDQEDRLRDLAAALGLNNDIVFAGFQKNPFVFIREAEVYAMTSLFEGFPNALVEAMACGVPVISVDCKSGPREILYKEADVTKSACEIEYADFGILCPAFGECDDWSLDNFSVNQRFFADAICTMLNDPDIHLLYSKKALERAGEFSYERCRDDYFEIIGGEKRSHV